MVITTGPRNSHGYRIPIWVLGNLFSFTTQSKHSTIIIFKLPCWLPQRSVGKPAGKGTNHGASLPARIPSPSPSVFTGIPVHPPRSPLCGPTHSSQSIWYSSCTLPDLLCTPSHTHLPQLFLASLHVMPLARTHTQTVLFLHSEQPLACLQAWHSQFPAIFPTDFGCR